MLEDDGRDRRLPPELKFLEDGFASLDATDESFARGRGAEESRSEKCQGQEQKFLHDGGKDETGCSVGMARRSWKARSEGEF